MQKQYLKNKGQGNNYGLGVSFWEDENVLKLIMVRNANQKTELYTYWMNYLSIKLLLKKTGLQVARLKL